MINQIFTKKKARNVLSKKEELSIFTEKFSKNENHYWICNNRYIFSIFMELFEKLNAKQLYMLNIGKELVFLRTNGKLSCALTTIDDASIIILYPELLKLLNSGAPQYGQAVLAHELGHIVLDHVKGTTEPMQAQVEADRFAYDIGLGEELVDVLSDFMDYEECRIRLTYLNALIMSKKKL